MVDLYRPPNRFEPPRRSRFAAQTSQPNVTGTTIYLTVSSQSFLNSETPAPPVFTADRRVALNAQAWVGSGGALFQQSATAAALAGATNYPTSFPAQPNWVALNSQSWVATSAQAPIIRVPDPPIGKQYTTNIREMWGRDARVAVGALDWVKYRGAIVIAPVTPIPVGVQYFPDRSRPLSAFVGFYSQHWMNFPSHTQKGNAHFGQNNSGAFIAVGTKSNLSVMSITGSGVFNAVGMATFASHFTMTGSGVFNAVGVAQTPSAFTMTGSGSFVSVGVRGAVAAFAMVGGGTFNAVGTTPTTKFGSATFPGAGTFKARGHFHNVLPFNYPPSWSIMIYGPTIEGAGYDPITRNLKVWFTGHLDQYIILENMGFQITNQIEAAKDPEAYILSLIRN